VERIEEIAGESVSEKRGQLADGHGRSG